MDIFEKEKRKKSQLLLTIHTELVPLATKKLIVMNSWGQRVKGLYYDPYSSFFTDLKHCIL